MKTFDFVALGFASNDHVAVVPFIPQDSKVQMCSHRVAGGGVAANAASGAVALGMRTAFVGTVGDDADGRMIIEEFERQGVDTSHIVVRPGATSAIAYIFVDEKTGARSIAWGREGLTELKADEIDADLIRKAKILHLDAHQPEGAIAAAKIAKAAGVIVSLDAGTYRDGTEELMALADILICSEEFIRKVTSAGCDNPIEDAVRALYAKYQPKVCGATMGVEGSVCFDGEKMVRVPAFKVEKVVDTTGCGDLFHMAFAVKYLETQDLTECQRFASAVSAIKCRGVGGRPPVAPTRAEVEEFLVAFRTKRAFLK